MTEPRDIHDILVLRDLVLDRANKELGATAWTDVLNVPVPEWLLPGLLQQESIHILTSDSGSGKSWLALSMMLSGIYDIPVLGIRPTKPFSSIYLAADSPRWDIGQQLRKLMDGHALPPPPSEPHAFILPMGFKFENENHVRLLADLSYHWDIDAVFFDVMLYTHSGDENDNGEMARRVLHPAKWLRDKCGLSLFFLHHNAKPQPDRPAAYRGAGTIVQAAEHHHSLRKRDGIITCRVEKLRGDELISGGEIQFTIAKQNGGRVLEPCEAPKKETPSVPPEPSLIILMRQRGVALSRAALLEVVETHHLSGATPAKAWLDNQLQYLKRKELVQRSPSGLWSLCQPPQQSQSPFNSSQSPTSSASSAANDLEV